ncbi:MAG TPA: hypothetical protein VFP65_02835 [Anaeromyxobacteraceae bacterium]|nr:hypothetical protein [Anaeromyxobacteraceae bacterium]
MRALVLNGAVALRGLADRVEDALCRALEARGYGVLRRDLAVLDVPDCRGDFGCWTTTPGVCLQPGPHRELAPALIRSDLVAWVTPVTFGGPSSCLKRHMDHWIPLVSSRFSMVRGETHHAPRYPGFPALLAVGILEAPDPTSAAVFRRIVRRNALNMHAPRVASPCLQREDVARAPELAGAWLDELATSDPPSSGPLDLTPLADLPPVKPARVLLLTGSPRGAASASAALAGAVRAGLERRGIAVEVEALHAARREDRTLRRVAAALWASDAVGLVAPLYVDGFPGPVVAALEALHAQRPAAAEARPRLFAIVNCGFPEAAHAHTALAVARLFAAGSGLDWIGGVAVGGGGMFAGKPLAEQGGRARNVARALALTADAVARGGTVPAEASRLAATLPIPAWLYRLLADRGFRGEARRRGAIAHLDERPYEP